MSEFDRTGSREKALNRTDFRVEDDMVFRLAQLLLLLEVSEENNWALSLDRLGILDFFAANPFLIVEPHDIAYKRLILAGFSVRPLMYASPGQRFVTRTSRIQHDLALLVSYSLAYVEALHGRVVYRITEKGKEVAAALGSVYAESYRASAEIIGNRIRALSDSKLRDNCRIWLKADPSLLDLYNV